MEQINIESANNKFVVWTDQSNPPNVRKLIEGKLFTETNKCVVGRSDKTRLEIDCTSESKPSKFDDFVEKLQSEDVEGDYHVRKSRLSYAVPESEQDQLNKVKIFKALTVITSAAKKFWTNSRKRIEYGVGYELHHVRCKDALNQNVILGYC